MPEGETSSAGRKREFDADQPAGTIEEDARESPRGDFAKVAGDADFDQLVGACADPPPQLGQGTGVHPPVALRRAISPNAVPGTAGGSLRGCQRDTSRTGGFSLRGEDSFGIEVSNGWMISATNSERPLTPAFAYSDVA